MLAATQQIPLDLSELFLELGMDVDNEIAAGVRPLHLAVVAGAIDVVKLLVARGADVDRTAESYGGRMELGARNGRLDLARILAPLSRDVHSMVSLGM